MITKTYDVYHPNGHLMCSISDNGRPSSIHPTNVDKVKNPSLPVWVLRKAIKTA